MGAGAGVGFVDSNNAFGSTQFAYQASSSGLVGILHSQWRALSEGRYIGTTNPSVNINGVNVSYIQ